MKKLSPELEIEESFEWWISKYSDLTLRSRTVQKEIKCNVMLEKKRKENGKESSNIRNNIQNVYVHLQQCNIKTNNYTTIYYQWRLALDMSDFEYQITQKVKSETGMWSEEM